MLNIIFTIRESLLRGDKGWLHSEGLAEYQEILWKSLHTISSRIQVGH